MDDVISHSSRRTFFAGGSNSGNGSHKSAYDDVFGGAAPKLPLPALAPRLEDYSEIFVGGSRSFSIPFLDLPPLAGDDSNRFDYAEVFGGVDFALSSPTEDFAAAGYDSSSDEQLWSPAQSESLSDEFDPLSRSDKSLGLSDAYHHQTLETAKQFNVSYDESPVSCDEEDENCSASVMDDLNASKEHGKRVAEDHENFTCKPFVTVSDISLRTKPSGLPPPSRPPPALKRGGSHTDTSYLKCKASRSSAFESVTDDASSLSTLSPEGTGNGNKDVDNCDEAVAWREGTEYFEVIGKNISEPTIDIIEDCNVLLHKMLPEDFQQFGEPSRLPTDDCETREVLIEVKSSLSEVDAKSKLKVSPEGMDTENKTAEIRDQQLSREVEKDNEKGHKLVHEKEVTKERNRDAPIVEDSGLRFKRVDTVLCHTSGVFKTKGHIDLSRTADALCGNAKETEPIGSNENEKEVESASTTVPRKQYNQGNGQLKADVNSINCERKTIGFIQHKNEGIAVNMASRGAPKQDTPQFISKTVDVKDSLIPCQVIRESSVVNGMKEKEKDSDDTIYSIKNATRQKIELRDYSNIKENLAAKGQKVGERIRRDIELENEHIRKIEEEREREREREKDRMAVDKATLEACERSYTEARERAAVDRAIAEVRQRAIERATSDARQRAAEKLMSQKAASNAHFRVERSASFKYSDAWQSSLSTVTDTHLKSTGISSNLRYAYSFGDAGADSDSPQRCKARLERYRRTAERAANALAEKNMRDLLVQREREEMNRVGETLDSEIKRWSGGKEANLRALLSTLQYILGPESGWQPVPLTEVITSAAVKRAYRKATLCVHPDKLQQRGATIQQKYICEKVFDLLKEAWNRFNSEEM